MERVRREEVEVWEPSDTVRQRGRPRNSAGDSGSGLCGGGKLVAQNLDKAQKSVTATPVRETGGRHTTAAGTNALYTVPTP